MFGLVFNIKIWIRLTGFLIDTAFTSGINTAFDTQVFICISNFTKGKFRPAILIFRQVGIAAIQHNRLAVRSVIDIPLTQAQIRLIDCTVHYRICSDCPQLLLITNQDIGFAVKLLNNLPRKVAAVCLAVRNHRIWLYGGIGTKLSGKNIAVIQAVCQIRLTFPVGVDQLTAAEGFSLCIAIHDRLGVWVFPVQHRHLVRVVKIDGVALRIIQRKVIAAFGKRCDAASKAFRQLPLQHIVRQLNVLSNGVLRIQSVGDFRAIFIGHGKPACIGKRLPAADFG